MIRFYNTQSRQLEEFKPVHKGEVRMYTCGPTVYNYPHIGNLRTFMFEDLLHRWLKYRGFTVKQVMNLTDVDDKTIRNSQEQKMELTAYTDIYKNAFFEDLKTLNITPAWKYPAATNHIEDMIKMIHTLKDKGYAYETEDGVYFRVSAFKEYGKLAHLDRDKLRTGASGRIDQDEYTKDNLSDFALWKKWTPRDGNVKWQADFGEGRPGWHLECSVMSSKYLGETLDIHAGGVDLIFPHHENELAQSEAANEKTFVNYWMHASHLVVEGEKMSKSAGNFFTLRDLIQKGYSPRAIRFVLITTHYRKPLNFTFEGLKAAQSSLKRIDDFVFMLQNIKTVGETSIEIKEALQKTRTNFESGLDEDLNIAESMGALFELIHDLNEQNETLTTGIAAEVLAFFKKINPVLGFLNLETDTDLSLEEQSLLSARAEARKNKDWAKSDKLRDELLKKGIEVRDTREKTIWKRIH